MPQTCGISRFLRIRMKTLVIGYGNLDRQDDGVAWHVMSELMQKYGVEKPTDINIDINNPAKDVHFLYQLQLLPELADELADYDNVVFIDAHNGAMPSDIYFEELSPIFSISPLTHHLSANSLLSITNQIRHKYPNSILVSIRGFEFAFSQELSSRTATLVPAAVENIQEWMNNQGRA